MTHRDCGDWPTHSRPGLPLVMMPAAVPAAVLAAVPAAVLAAVPAAVLAAVLAAALGCTKSTEVGGTGETHFLRSCSAAADCLGGLDCVCGACTLRCDENGDCGDYGDQAVCRPSDCSSERVCEVECKEDGDCAELGSGYACDNGACRAAGSNSTEGGSGGDAGSDSGEQSAEDCRGAGHYEAGKEGDYLPCCDGLKEVFQQQAGHDGDNDPICWDPPLRVYACVAGECGDGVCEVGEDKPCGCVEDCPGAIWENAEDSGVCGNGVLEGDEQCDGADLGNERCVTLGYGEGLLSCDPDTCTYDVSMCDRSGVSYDAGTGGPIDECPSTGPPYADPYCINPACPFSDLPGLTVENSPKGNCCNTVDVRRMEDAMPSGETYDLEMAFLSNLPLANPNLTSELVRDTGLKLKQDVGGDLTLIRIQDVPRTEDHPTFSEGSPRGLRLTMQMGAGKLNCDGTFSFYGPDSAPPPVHPEAGVPDDPGRWTPITVPVTFYGFQGDYLYTADEADAAAAGLNWGPRWTNNGTGLDYELPTRFHFIKASNDPLGSHYSCIGRRATPQDWNGVAVFWAFLPIEQSRHVSTDVLLGQSLCGLFAKGALSGDCDDAQSDWPVRPPAYCNEETGYCWMGDPGDEYYDDFWNDFYPGEDGCDETGAGDRPCCDPAGEDSDLPACNAFPYIGELVLAAVEITDEPVGSADDAASSISLCQ